MKRAAVLLSVITLISTIGFASAAPPPPSFSDLAERVKPSVVNIGTSRLIRGPFTDPFRDFFERLFPYPFPREFRQRSLGSGFIVSKEGLIITNNHVIERAEKIQVVLSDGERYDADVMGRDPKTDIALLKIKVRRELPVATLGNSDELKVGDWVIAVGNPFGLGHTVTAGIVSAKGRVIGAGPYDDFIQTDASINPGNSGGPLFNLRGEVVGINTAIVAGGQGIGFAIPINLAKEVLPQLRERGKVVRGWLGVTIQRLTPELARSFGLKRDEGVLISGVSPGSPADRAGIKIGDVIVEYDGMPIKDYGELPRMVANTQIGKEVLIKVIRKGGEVGIRVKIGEMPGEETAEAPRGDLGMAVAELTPELARRFGLEERGGLVVTDVAPEGPAEEAGIQRGDLILQVEQRPVKTLSDYYDAIDRVKDKDAILLLIKSRNRGNHFTILKRS